MKKLLLLSVFFAVFSVSSASAYDCLGKVNTLVIGPNGTVNATLGNISWVSLCNVSTTYNGVAPDSCKSIYSTLLAAKLADKNVRMWFGDTSNNCTNTAHPAWADLKDWYFGPSIE